MYPLRLLSRPVAAIRFCPSGPVGNVSDDNIFLVFSTTMNKERLHAPPFPWAATVTTPCASLPREPGTRVSPTSAPVAPPLQAFVQT